MTRQTARVWRRRFAIAQIEGLSDEPHCGAPRKIGDDRIEAIIVKTLETKPENATDWSTRDMARASGVSMSSVHRIWRAFSDQHHRIETVKLSTDPQFVEKVLDIVGLYLDPPAKALVICVDEKSQIQSLDRPQPFFADATRAGGTQESRLRAPRHDDALRGIHRRSQRRDEY